MALALAVTTWLFLHYWHGVGTLQYHASKSVASRPLFINQGRIYWHTPWWVYYLPVGTSLLRGKWAAFKSAIWHFGSTGLRFAGILYFWNWLL